METDKNVNRAEAILWLNVADWSLTAYGIKAGIFVEANPLLAGWIGGWQGLLVKTLGVGVVLLILVAIGKPNSVVLKVLLWLYTFVVIWNTLNLAAYWLWLA